MSDAFEQMEQGARDLAALVSQSGGDMPGSVVATISAAISLKRLADVAERVAWLTHGDKVLSGD